MNLIGGVDSSCHLNHLNRFNDYLLCPNSLNESCRRGDILPQDNRRNFRWCNQSFEVIYNGGWWILYGVWGSVRIVGMLGIVGGILIEHFRLTYMNMWSRSISPQEAQIKSVIRECAFVLKVSLRVLWEWLFCLAGLVRIQDAMRRPTRLSILHPKGPTWNIWSNPSISSQMQDWGQADHKEPCSSSRVNPGSRQSWRLLR